MLLIAVRALSGIERQATAEQSVRVKVSQHQIRVGHGRQRSAPVVAGRSWIGAGALRSHLQKADFVDPADRAAAGPQAFDLDHRNADPVAQEIDILVDVGDAILG